MHAYYNCPLIKRENYKPNWIATIMLGLRRTLLWFEHYSTIDIVFWTC